VGRHYGMNGTWEARMVMAQPVIAGKGSFLAGRRTVSPNASLQCNRSTAGDWEPALLNHNHNHRMGPI
jgi:hypothetical protein